MLISAMVLLLGSVAAQDVTVSGSLHDKKSDAPLPYSNVIILNPEDSVLNGGMTGKDGSFKLVVTPDEALRLEASGLGYKKQTFPLVFTGKSDVDLGKIVLERDSLVLDEVDTPRLHLPAGGATLALERRAGNDCGRPRSQPLAGGRRLPVPLAFAQPRMKGPMNGLDQRLASPSLLSDPPFHDDSDTATRQR